MKPSRRDQRPARRFTSDDVAPLVAPSRIKIDRSLTAKTQNQKRYINLILANPLTFGLGPAGTGKTYVAAWLAADAFDKGDIRKLIVTRPAVEAGESLGFLPGLLEEKIDPYFVPVREALERRLGKTQVEYMVKAKQLEFVPLAFMRGRTFDDAWVIADEMQNSTPRQMKMLLTRAGEGSKLIVNGDLRQSDIEGENGLADAIERFHGYPSIATLAFTRDDVVRSGLARLIVDAYEGNGGGPSDLPAFITGSQHRVDTDRFTE